MSSPPTLGKLALQQRFVDSKTLDDCLRIQRQNYLNGDFRRLGEILIAHGHCTRQGIRGLLARQGVAVVACTLCDTRYNAIMFRKSGRCLRCGRRLRITDEHASLTVEDSISGGGADADRLLSEHRQRNPRLGPYEILGEVGRGNMGVIYKAWEERLSRHVALKFLRPEDDVTEEDRERFRREARAVARLKHENIVKVHAIEERSGSIFLAMDFVEGISMEQLAQRGALNREQAVRAGVAVANALHYAHQNGIVHRDVKPQNIMVDNRGKPHLVDFGIAKDRQEEHSLTTEEEVLGSLAYMAPEYVIQGKEALDHRCDVYGLGVVLYEVLTGGYLPYGDPADPKMIKRLFKEEPVPIAEVAPDLPPDLSRVVMRALARDVNERYGDAATMGKELQRVLDRMTESQQWRLSGAPGKGSDAPTKKLESGREPGQRESGREARERPPSKRLPPREGAGDRPSRRVPPREHDVPEDVRGPTPRPPLRAAPGQVVGPSGTGRTYPYNLPPAVLVLAGAVTVLIVALAVLWGLERSRTEEIREELRQTKQQVGWVEMSAGQALEKAGDLKGAEAAYGRAIQALPLQPDPLHARASVRRRLGDVSGADADSNAAMKLEAAGQSEEQH